MEIYGPKQRVSDHRWDYTYENSSGTYACGYCHAYREPDGGPYWTPEQVELHHKHKDQFHSDGHATAEEAQDCYREYLVDFMVHAHDTGDTQKKCKVCGAWTQHVVDVGNFQRFEVCAEHVTRDKLLELMRAADATR